MEEHSKTTSSNKASLFEKLRFALVGATNTLVDFGIFNTLIFAAHLPVIAANLISTFTAMCLSLVLNKYFVFQDKEPLSGKKFVLFIGITLVSIWVIQSSIIALLNGVLSVPLHAAAQTLHEFTGFNEKFFADNIAKVFATFASLVWNYYFYKRLVFKKA